MVAYNHAQGWNAIGGFAASPMFSAGEFVVGFYFLLSLRSTFKLVLRFSRGHVLVMTAIYFGGGFHGVVKKFRCLDR